MKAPVHNSVFPQKIFITGTDTGIGKTLVAAILMTGLQANYWKPVQSGLTEKTDTEWIKEKTGLPDAHFHPETHRLNQPLSPHAAAAIDGVSIKIKNFHMPPLPQNQHLIVEGAGGVMVPINDHQFMLDLMKQLAIPVLLVTSSRLGTINHTLLTIEQLKRSRLEILGIVINGPANRINREAIAKYSQIPVIAEIPPLAKINPAALNSCFHYFSL
jgi:dethiobiotin synthetase